MTLALGLDFNNALYSLSSCYCICSISKFSYYWSNASSLWAFKVLCDVLIVFCGFLLIDYIIYGIISLFNWIGSLILLTPVQQFAITARLFVLLSVRDDVECINFIVYDLVFIGFWRLSFLISASSNRL